MAATAISLWEHRSKLAYKRRWRSSTGRVEAAVVNYRDCNAAVAPIAADYIICNVKNPSRAKSKRSK